MADNVNNTAWVSYENLAYFKSKSDEIYGATVQIDGQTIKLISKSGAELSSGTIVIPEVKDVTTTSNGLMLATDKVKLDAIAEGATKVEANADNGYITINGTKTKVYQHSQATAHDSGLYKIQVDAEGHVIAVTAVQKSDITDLGIPGQDTTYEAVTTDADGLMIAADKAKLDGIAAGAQVNVIETVKVNGAALPVSDKTVEIDLTPYALKSDVARAITVKGSVETYADLPEDAAVGDMYDVKTADAANNVKAGDNVVWTGEAWDNFGGIFTIDEVSNSDIDALFN